MDNKINKRKRPNRRFITAVLLMPAAAFTLFYFWAGGSMNNENTNGEIIRYHQQKQPNHVPPVPKTDQTFTIMTYNIGYLSGMLNNRPVKREKPFFEQNMDQVVQMLTQHRPTIIAFQEIDYDSARSFRTHQLNTIAQRVGMPFGAKAVNWDKRYVPFPYWPPSVHFGKMLSGQAVLSAFPISHHHITRLERSPNNPFYYNAFYLDRLAQMVRLETPAGPLTVINVHLEAYDAATRVKHAQMVLELYRRHRRDTPVILTGDYNSLPPDAKQKNRFSDEPEADYTNDHTMAILLAEESLAIAESRHLTFPSEKPTRKLDYFLYDRETIQCLEVVVPEVKASDHLPLMMTFKIIPPSPAVKTAPNNLMTHGESPND